VAGVLTLVSCTSDGGDTAAPATPSPSPPAASSPAISPSPSLESWDFCDNIRAFGWLPRAVRKGVDLPDEIIAVANALQARLAFNRGGFTDVGGQDEVRELAAAIGQLELAIAAAGADYPSDALVSVRAWTVSSVTLTAALAAGCKAPNVEVG
jgi:hypothetical protein